MTLLTVLLLLVTTLRSLAQTSVSSIDGNVRDEKGHPIEAATITLLNVKDSSRVRQTVTDKSGHFGFDRITSGNYLISASSVGYSVRYSPAFDLSANRSSRVLPPLVLTTAGTTLKEFRRGRPKGHPSKCKLRPHDRSTCRCFPLQCRFDPPWTSWKKPPA